MSSIDQSDVFWRLSMLVQALLVIASLAACEAASSPVGDHDAGQQKDAAGFRDSAPVAADAAEDSGVSVRNDGGFTVSPTCKHPVVTKACSQGMCLVPAGCFVMGVPRTELFAAAEDDLETEVTLTHGFLIGETEVTLAQWRASGFPDPQVDWTISGSMDPATPPRGYSLCASENCPVTFVSFEDAMAYANAKSEAEGLAPCYVLSDCASSPGRHLRCHSVKTTAKSPYECEGYRLPTEAEWEYAIRAGTRTAYYSGDMDPKREVSENCGLDANLDAIGWYCGNSGAPPGETGGHAHEVAQKRPNAWGLYDGSGNAYEWTNDIYNPFGYGAGPLIDPVGGVSDPSELTPDKHPVYEDYSAIDGFPGYRVMRGGAFDLWSFVAKSGRRSEVSGPGGQFNGFRIVRSVDTALSSAAP